MKSISCYRHKINILVTILDNSYKEKKLNLNSTKPVVMSVLLSPCYKTELQAYVPFFLDLRHDLSFGKQK